MSDVKESYFWSQVKSGLENPDTHLSRIENTAGTGISDVSACSFGREVWIELKVFHGKRLHFRNSQRTWILRRAQVGGRVLVLTRNDDAMSLYHGPGIMFVPYKQESGGKSFSVLKLDLPEPIFTCKKPFRWASLRDEIFEFRGV